MKIDPKNIRLYAVTDRSGLKNRTLPQAVEEAILGGATMVQLREKTLTDSCCVRRRNSKISPTATAYR